MCLRLRPLRPAEGWRTWRPWRLSREQQGVALWGMWLLTQVIFFSVASFFHAYYLVMLAPAICALVGIGVVELRADFLRPGWQGWRLPAALVITALVQARLLSYAPGWNSWLAPLLVALCLGCALALALVRLARQQRLPAWLTRAPAKITPSVWASHARPIPRRLAFAVVFAAMGIFALLLAPTAWSLASLQRSDGLLPTAGPLRQGNFSREQQIPARRWTPDW